MTEASTRRWGRRRLAGALAGALALSVLPFAFPASSQTDAEPDLRDIRINACPVDPGPDGELDTADDPGTTEVPEDGFTDMAEGADFEFDVDCVAWYDVTSGATETTYNPLGTVSRGQMATFIANLIEYVDPGALAAASNTTEAFPCPSDPDEFADDTHLGSVELLADAGVVLGGPGELPASCFGPKRPVTRAHMASFIAQAQKFLGEAITADPGGTTTTVADTTTTVAGATTTTVAGTAFPNFFDDDDDNIHEGNINAIASEGIAVGTSARTYSPEAPIRRGQMAAFLARKLDYLIEAGDTQVPASITVTVDPATLTAAAGGPVDLTITPSAGTVASASVTGCGITTPVVTSADAEPATPGFQAEAIIPTGQTEGTCDLTVVATLDDDRTASDTATITLT